MKAIGYVLQTPMILLMIISFAASVYAAYNNIQEVSWTTAVIIGLFLLMYFVGRFINREEN
jgi:tellurite resistance protein TehA-like permease